MQAIRTQHPTTMAQVRPMIRVDVTLDLRIKRYQYQEGVGSVWSLTVEAIRSNGFGYASM
jgi:hypothetical protein